MHIPDGFLHVGVFAPLWAVSAAGIGGAVSMLKRRLNERLIPAAALLGAFIFVAQMLNFPIGGGTSGHLIGAAIAVVALGPWLGMLVMTLVLCVQCLVFADGGITALGANVFNMAIVAGLTAYLVHNAAGRVLRGSAGRYAVWFLAGWSSVVVSALCCALELSASGIFPFKQTLLAMGTFHALIGIGEGAITVVVLAALARMPGSAFFEARREAPSRPVWIYLMAAIIVVAMLLTPFASGAPDGLEKTAETVNAMEHEATVMPFSIMGDYAVPGVGSPVLSTLLAALTGLWIVLGASLLVLAFFRKRTPPRAEK